VFNSERFRTVNVWASRRQAKTRAPRLWGDGLVDLSISSLYYPCGWEDVGEDELAFLLPTLQRTARATGDIPGGPHRFFRRALIARIHNLIGRVGKPAGSDNDDATAKVILDTIVCSGVIKSVSLAAAGAEGRDAWSKLYNGTRDSHPKPTLPGRNPLDSESLAFWIFELSVLATLDRAVNALAANPEKAQPADGVQLVDALITSIFSGINAAYAFPHLESAHELLTVGAWLGCLLRGRTALMPPFIAERLIDHLSRVRGEDVTDAAKCEDVIYFHAEAAAGASRLLRTAKRVYRTGTASLVRPSAGPADHKRPPVWNDALTKFIAASLEARALTA
jgi:hypothetical protein